MKFRLSGHTITIALSTLIVVSAALAMPTEQDTWLRAKTENFTLLGNTEASRIISMGENLERFREVLLRGTEGLEFNSPLSTTIFVFKDSASMAPYNLGDDGSPKNIEGYFQRSMEGNYVAVNASAPTLPYAVVYHEYLHYLLENSISSLPLWLNEGLAEFYSTFQLTDDAAVFGLPMAHHVEWLKSHAWMSLDSLFAIDTSSEDYNEGERQSTYYAQSWALAHYLMTDPRRRDRFGRLIAHLERGTPAVEAMETTFETDILALEKEVQTHALSGATKFHRQPLENGFSEGSAKLEPLERKQVLFHLGDLLAHLVPVQEEATEEHLLAALALDKSYTDVYVSLAALRLHQERFDEVVELTSKALEIDPDNVRASVLRGIGRLMRFSATVEQNPDVLRSEESALALAPAREDFQRALNAQPKHVEALAGLGSIDILEGENLEEGVSALALAFQAQPARTDILVRLITVTAQSGNVAGAQNLLQRALRPRGDAESTRLAEEALVEIRMEEFTALLMENKPDEALALLRELADDVTDRGLRARLVSAIGIFEAEHKAELLRQEAIAAGAAGDKARAEELMRQAGEVYGHGQTAENETAQFEQAVEMTERGEYEAALEIFDRIAESGTRPQLRTMAAHLAEDARRRQARSQAITRYNEAIDALNDGDSKRAETLLLEFLEGQPDEDLRLQAEEVLREARRRLERSGGK